jgi:hypothetical protein
LQVESDVQRLSTAKARQGTADDFATNLVSPLKQLLQRISSCTADLQSLEARVGENSGGNFMQVETRLAASEVELSKVDARRSELIGIKLQLGDERERRRSRYRASFLLPAGHFASLTAVHKLGNVVGR